MKKKHLICSRTSECAFFLDIEKTGFQDHEDWYRKPLHHDIQGSLRISYFREAKPRPPPTDVLPENLQLCKW